MYISVIICLCLVYTFDVLFKLCFMMPQGALLCSGPHPPHSPLLVFLPPVGNHGYDNALPSMHPFLAASGPGFRQGYRMSGLQSVDVYPLMCHLLGVAPAPHNGSLAKARCLLQGEGCLDVALVAGVVVGVLLLLTSVTCESPQQHGGWLLIVMMDVMPC